MRRREGEGQELRQDTKAALMTRPVPPEMRKTDVCRRSAAASYYKE